jgi:hypothetical protein
VAEALVVDAPGLVDLNLPRWVNALMVACIMGNVRISPLLKSRTYQNTAS